MIDLATLDVVPHPHPALRWVAKPIPHITPLIQDVARRMIELMHDHKGAGLAATQVAIPWRMFVTSVNDKELVFINPQVHLGRNKKDTNPRMVWDFEACLSFPGLRIEEKIPRARDVYVEATDIDGKPFTISGPGMLSRVIQHENDHLNGVIFLDHMKLEGFLQMGKEKISLKDYVAGYCRYLESQYEFITPPKSGKPRYGTNEEEKDKLVKLENFLLEKAA